MAFRLSKVDELTRGDHSYLRDTDHCLFLGEYTARKGYQYSATNRLILNLKKSPIYRGKPPWKYKMQAIAQAAQLLREALGTETNLNWLRNATLVPVPPSKCKTDNLYDDRMLRVLHMLGRNAGLDIRELVLQRESTEAAHNSQSRPTPDDLIANYDIDENLCTPEPVAIGVFDDLLTTGCHFRAVKTALTNRFGNVPISGIFLARRVPSADDFGIFDVLDP